MTNLYATAKPATGVARTERDGHLARLIEAEWLMPASITGLLGSVAFFAFPTPDRGEAS